MYIYAGIDHITAMTEKIHTENHTHLALQVSLSLQNKFRITVYEKDLTCQGIIIDSNVKHTFHSDKNNTHVIVMIDNTSTIAAIIKQLYLSNAPFYLIDKNTMTMLQLMINKNHPILSKEQYLEIYHEFLKTLQISSDSGKLIDERIVTVLSLIKNSKSSELNIDDLAKKVFLSKSRLSHLFKKEVGITLSSYMVFNKLKNALFYIFSGMNITDAALTAGFNNPSHFAAVCKKSLGMSARDIKKDSFFLKVSPH